MSKVLGQGKKVVVGMSGGVDSSVTAYLLKEQGYDVIGVTMQIWQDEDMCDIQNNGGCCGLSAVEDARRVCEMLDIPHYVMNFRDIFKEKVIDNFVSEYLVGHTPNPCIRCNRFIKWDALLRRSLEIGADYIATGHYARIRRLENGRYAICKSVTEDKDQTYALFSLTQDQLSHTVMPLGEYHKDEVRKIAKKIGLLVADKPDSQEICFIPDNKYSNYLEKYVSKPSVGNFVTTEGEVLGVHKGIYRYTIGQRKGLQLAIGKPLYVCEIRPKTNEVVLGKNEDTFTEEVYCTDLHYMAVEDFESCGNITAKIRYGKSEKACRVSKIDKNELSCIFESKVRAATPGQAIVFYDRDEVLGGGTICQYVTNHN